MARIAGAAEAVLKKSVDTTGPATRIEVRELRRTLAPLRDSRASPPVVAAWCAGRTAGLEDVVAEALTLQLG